jgi:hypothetical protein
VNGTHVAQDSSGLLLLTRWCIFGFHERRGLSWQTNGLFRFSKRLVNSNRDIPSPIFFLHVIFYRIFLRNPEGKRPLGRPRRKWADNFKFILERQDGVEWTASIWLRIGTSGGLLWTRWWTFGFHKMLGNSWVAAQLVASQERLSSVKLVNTPYFSPYWDA